MSGDTLEKGIELLKKIESLGYEAYIVGGAVRDCLLGHTVHDVDIATNCSGEILDKNFRTHVIGQSRKFGTVVVMHKDGFYEITQFRADGDYSDGRHPDNVEMVNNFKEDVFRRDFTINALGLGSDGCIIDYVGGQIDLYDRIVRTVGNPYDRFKEDYLRMMRAARFAARDEFTLERITRKAIRKLSPNILKVSEERIREELVKVAEGSGKEFARFILILDDLKILSKILPEITALKYFNHDLHHHPEGLTVFDHVIACLCVMADEPYMSKISVLLHDVGKAVAFQQDGSKTSYHGHARAGEKVVEHIARRLKFSKQGIDTLVFAAKHHMKFHHMLDMKASKIARFVNDPNFSTLVDVARADEFARGETFKHKGTFEAELQRAMEIKEAWKNRVVNHRIKLVDGNRVIDLTGLNPGPAIGKIIKAVEEFMIDNSVDPEDKTRVDELILKADKLVLEAYGKDWAAHEISWPKETK